MITSAYGVVGLAYGDEGKGTIVDYLVRETCAKTVVRFNGGPQAGHNVVTSDGIHHCFSQLGAGTLAGASTYLSRFMLIDPYTFLNEAEVLAATLGMRVRDVTYKVFVECQCPVITPYHVLRNRTRGVKHGTCGMGVGELRSDEINGGPMLYAGDLDDSELVRAKLHAIHGASRTMFLGDTETLAKFSAVHIETAVQAYKHYAELVTIVKTNELFSMHSGCVVLEGAQGVLLDETFGFAPYNTWTDTTFGNMDKLFAGKAIPTYKIGVLRTYFTRHGAGPFVTHDPAINYPDHNVTGPWQGALRQGHFDAVAAGYAASCVPGLSGLAVTHLDKLVDGKMKWVDSYELRSKDGILREATRLIAGSSATQQEAYRPSTVRNDDWREVMARVNSLPVCITSAGNTAQDKTWT